MNETQNDTQQETFKSVYHTPQLVSHGRFTALTQQASGGGDAIDCNDPANINDPECAPE